ncbi:MAG: imelysin family protein [Gammaproteobacteria bacterium]|nr:imelysin family protein [Gammaproteobacteria bacterium]
MAHAKYEDSLFTAHKLQKAVDKLIAKPSESRLKTTRVARKAARLPYYWSWRSR